VDKVVAPDDVYSAAVELVSRYVTGPALALRAAKAAIDGGLDGDLASGLRLETQLFTGLFATEDRASGWPRSSRTAPARPSSWAGERARVLAGRAGSDEG
jgi:enoyl-CoA hydratase